MHRRRTLPVATALFPLLTLLSGCGHQDGMDSLTLEETPPLVTAAESGDLAGISRLLDGGADPDDRDHCDWSPLMKAALNGHTEVVIRLLQSGATLDLGDKGSYTALLLAASNDHAAIVALLGNAGADLDHQEATEGNSALIWAAKLGHRRTVEVLLANGANPGLRDHQGQTALDWARHNGDAEVVALLDRGAAP